MLAMAAGGAARAGDICWELVDPVAAADQLPAAVAVTRPAPGGVVDVVLLWVAAADDGGALMHLIRELVAALRRSTAVALTLRVADPQLLRSLLDEDLVHAGTGDPGQITLVL